MQKLDLPEIQKMIDEINGQIAPLEAELKKARAIEEEARSKATPDLKAAIAEVSSYEGRLKALKGSPITGNCSFKVREWLTHHSINLKKKHLDYFSVLRKKSQLEARLDGSIKARDCLKSSIEAMQQ